MPKAKNKKKKQNASFQIMDVNCKDSVLSIEDDIKTAKKRMEANYLFEL